MIELRRVILLIMAVAAQLVTSGHGVADEIRSVADSWAALRTPTRGEAQSFGSPAAGCIAGAEALPLSGSGYQVLRQERNRFWGHPRTVAFVRSLGHEVAAAGMGEILIGDLSQPRGGPMAFGHGSHQNGLDVDIWFKLVNGRLSAAEISHPQAVSMVNGTKVNPRTWTSAHLHLLEMAARSPEVERIFVNPPIKAAACRQARGERGWLAKLRPWWGHDEHFHVRLSCTSGDSGCVPQSPVPEGDGCGAELASWIEKPVLLPRDAKDRPNRRRPVLPAACQPLLTSGDVTAVGAR